MDENRDNPAEVRTSPRSALELVTEEEHSALLKVSKRQLYNRRTRGEVPYYKLGPSVLFRVGDVVDALERMRVSLPCEGGPGRVTYVTLLPFPVTPILYSLNCILSGTDTAR